METFVCSTRLCFGENALQALQTLGAKRAFLVTDPFFAKNGTAQRILSLLPDAETEVFDRVGGEPTLAMVAQGVDQLQKFRPDTLLALGGGSAIDCAKGILSLAQSEARLVAIPTTSGTGSEVTSFSILTHEGVKHPLIDEALRPQLAILDDSLLRALPKGHDRRRGYGRPDALSGSDCLQKRHRSLPPRWRRPPSAQRWSSCPPPMPATPPCAVASMKLRPWRASPSTTPDSAYATRFRTHWAGEFHLAHGRLNAILLPPVAPLQCAAPRPPMPPLPPTAA